MVKNRSSKNQRRDKVKPTSIPEHNRTAEIQTQTIQELTARSSVLKDTGYFVAFPFVMLWRIFKHWWEMYE